MHPSSLQGPCSWLAGPQRRAASPGCQARTGSAAVAVAAGARQAADHKYIVGLVGHHPDAAGTLRLPPFGCGACPD
jgi:hypothetical protein